MNAHTTADPEAELHPFLADHERFMERDAAAEGVSVETYRRARKAYQDVISARAQPTRTNFIDEFHELKQAIRILHLLLEENFANCRALRDLGELDEMETMEDLLCAQSCHVMDLVGDFEAEMRAAK